MEALPSKVRQAWKERAQPSVLGSIDEDGTPNLIWVTCTALLEDGRFAIADNYFSKTRANIQRGSKGSLLFRTEDDEAYQAKGTFEYHDSGKIFDEMKCWNHPGLPGNAVAVLTVEEVYSGAEKLS